MAEAVKRTERVIEDRESVVLTMSREEAEAVYNILWLVEITGSNSKFFNGAKDVQSAIRRAIELSPVPTRLRFDFNAYNDAAAIHLIENEF